MDFPTSVAYTSDEVLVLGGREFNCVTVFNDDGITGAKFAQVLGLVAEHLIHESNMIETGRGLVLSAFQGETEGTISSGTFIFPSDPDKRIASGTIPVYIDKLADDLPMDLTLRNIERLPFILNEFDASARLAREPDKLKKDLARLGLQGFIEFLSRCLLEHDGERFSDGNELCIVSATSKEFFKAVYNAKNGIVETPTKAKPTPPVTDNANKVVSLFG